jgi:hypothetical protein
VQQRLGEVRTVRLLCVELPVAAVRTHECRIGSRFPGPFLRADATAFSIFGVFRPTMDLLARPAPMATRTASSLRRPAVRRSWRWATFTHAIIKTNRTAARRTRIARLTSPTIFRCSDAFSTFTAETQQTSNCPSCQGVGQFASRLSFASIRDEVSENKSEDGRGQQGRRRQKANR